VEAFVTDEEIDYLATLKAVEMMTKAIERAVRDLVESQTGPDFSDHTFNRLFEAARAGSAVMTKVNKKKENPTHKILRALGDGPKTFKELKKITGIDFKILAKTLKKEVEARFIKRTGLGVKGDPHIYTAGRISEI
jgi:predicted HTH transcriptional regulator